MIRPNFTCILFLSLLNSASPGIGASLDQLRSRVNEYAICLLSDTPKHQERKCSSAVQDYLETRPSDKVLNDPEATYTYAPTLEFIGLSPDTAESCFPNYGTLNRWQKRHLEKKLKRQIKELVFFSIQNLAYRQSDEYKTKLGMGWSSFLPTRLEICSNRQEGSSTFRPIKWKPMTKSLITYIDQNPIPLRGSIYKDTLSSDQILELWNKGIHLAKDDPTLLERIKIRVGLSSYGPKKSIGLVWMMVNPLGEFRNAVLDELTLTGHKIVKAIQNFQQVLNNGSEYHQLEKNIGKSELDAGELSELDPKAQASIETIEAILEGADLPGSIVEFVGQSLTQNPEIWQDPAILPEVLQRWQEILTQKGYYENFTNSLQSSVRLCDIRSDETKKLNGFVVVENNHTISVCVGDPNAGMRTLKTHVELHGDPSVELELRNSSPNVIMASTRKVEASGFVVVSTSDNVTVEGPLFHFLNNLVNQETKQRLIFQALQEAILEVTSKRIEAAVMTEE